MTSFEAIQILARRARREARLGWLLGMISLATVFVSTVAGLTLINGPSKRTGAVAAYVTLAAAMLVVPVTHAGVKVWLRRRRPVWIEELARREGLDAKRLAESFTLDSW